MTKEVERLAEHYENIKKEQHPDAVLIQSRKKETRSSYNAISERNRKREAENFSKFEEYGISEMFRTIIEKKSVIQDDSLKYYAGIEQAKYEYDRHYKKCTLVFDKNSHKITISLPFKNGLNIHGFEDGQRIVRNRIDFADKNNEQVRQEIAVTVFEQIATLQGYKADRVNFDQI